MFWSSSIQSFFFFFLLLDISFVHIISLFFEPLVFTYIVQKGEIFDDGISEIVVGLMCVGFCCDTLILRWFGQEPVQMMCGGSPLICMKQNCYLCRIWTTNKYI